MIDLKKKSTKLIDFGLSAQIGDYRVMTQGTPVTMAPEVAFLDYYTNRMMMYGPGGPANEAELKKYANQPQELGKQWIGGQLEWLFIIYLLNFWRWRAKNKDWSWKLWFSLGRISETYSYDTTTVSDNPKVIVENAESDDHYFPYKIVWTKDNRDILDFKYRPVPAAFPPALKTFSRNWWFGNRKTVILEVKHLQIKFLNMNFYKY